MVETDINGCYKQISGYLHEVFNAIGDLQHGSFAIVVGCHVANGQGRVCQMADDIRGFCIGNMVWDVGPVTENTNRIVMVLLEESGESVPTFA